MGYSICINKKRAKTNNFQSKPIEYIAGINSRPFWYIESKKTARYIVENLDRKFIRESILSENTYQTSCLEKTNHMFNSIYKRLNSLDTFLIQKVVTSDVLTSKILVLFSIMKTDRLFFEFMYEVFREKLLLGDYFIRYRDINNFFDNKKTQSDIVLNWSSNTVKKLKKSYIKILFEAGLINDLEAKIIKPVLLDYRLCDYLKSNGMSAYLATMEGC